LLSVHTIANELNKLASSPSPLPSREGETYEVPSPLAGEG
jgi:hypothetical protein